MGLDDERESERVGLPVEGANAALAFGVPARVVVRPDLGVVRAGLETERDDGEVRRAEVGDLGEPRRRWFPARVERHALDARRFGDRDGTERRRGLVVCRGVGAGGEREKEDCKSHRQ